MTNPERSESKMPISRVKAAELISRYLYQGELS